MVDYSPEDMRFARLILDRIATNEEELSHRPRIRDVLVDDVVEDLEGFAQDFTFLEDLKMPMFPAAPFEDGDKVPIDLALVMPKRVIQGRDLRQVIFRATEAAGLVFVPHEEARATVWGRAMEFIASRFAGDRQIREEGLDGHSSLFMSNPAQPSTGPTPGCRFTVTTNTHGLRVLWSGAYRISANLFSSPSSPAKSILQSGVYRFGVDGGAYKSPRWDMNAKVSLPGATSAHLNF
jgi:hypothetical protein